ncbi:MAG TPA: glutamate-5-semialdehyde dehydrogenase [Candidatus Acidoferrales bacterium]|nr:glutamate-5-semialdehyde dehydrogenase [Candidatus Acidoferrales bacterium]
MTTIETKAKSVKKASGILYNATTAEKNGLLNAIALQLERETEAICKINQKDLAAAEKAGISEVLLDRLTLNDKRIAQMIAGVHDVVALPDPVGEILERTKRPNGLTIEKVRVPLGAVGIIYEARPNVTVDASVLCLKAGNAVLLRGGSEAIRTNRKLVEIIKKALKSVGLPAGCVEFIDTTDRKAVAEMLEQDRCLDIIIPRGSQQLIKYIQANSSIPVIAHGEGNCHVYVDSSANLRQAEEIVVNAKVQRPSVCNAAEKLLVHERIAKTFLPRVAEKLRSANVELRGDRYARAILHDAVQANEGDWYREYLDLVIGIKVVKGLDEAIEHINRYGSHHSDAIVTGSKSNGEKFLREVDSAAVYVNASTRFTDGFEFGLGAEIGISTQKLHARGPMGLAELTSMKFVVRGNGQVRK